MLAGSYKPCCALGNPGTKGAALALIDVYEVIADIFFLGWLRIDLLLNLIIYE